MPVTDIDPTTVMVNGVAFPERHPDRDPNTANWLNGIPDAIITITPRSALNLATGVRTITITGQTLATSPLPNETWTGSATVTVTGSSSAAAAPQPARRGRGRPGARDDLQFAVRRQPVHAVDLAALGLQLRPDPADRGLAAVSARPGLHERIYAFNHPGKHLKNYLTIRGPAATGIYKAKEPQHLRQQQDPRPQPLPRPASPTPGRTRPPRSAASTGRRPDPADDGECRRRPGRQGQPAIGRSVPHGDLQPQHALGVIRRWPGPERGAADSGCPTATRPPRGYLALGPRGHDLREPVGQPLQRRAAVVRVEVDVEQAEARRVRQRGLEGGVELAHGPDLQAQARRRAPRGPCDTPSRGCR